MPLLLVIQSAVLRRVSMLGLPAGARVLDGPCGAGALALSLTQAGFEAWGVDFEAEARPVLHEASLWAI
jgi:cyclopropane fatty-acyl-phospholipid synthase-like methyltransferase